MCMASGAACVHTTALSAWCGEVAAVQNQCPIQVLVAIAARCFSCCQQVLPAKAAWPVPALQPTFTSGGPDQLMLASSRLHTLVTAFCWQISQPAPD